MKDQRSVGHAPLPLADIWRLLITIIVVVAIIAIFLAYERRKWKARATRAEK